MGNGTILVIFLAIQRQSRRGKGFDMPWFRECNNPVEKATAPVTLSSLRQVRLLAGDALPPEHFFLRKSFDLQLEHVAREEKPVAIYLKPGGRVPPLRDVSR